jgi:hypothetical protein
LAAMSSSSDFEDEAPQVRLLKPAQRKCSSAA